MQYGTEAAEPVEKWGVNLKRGSGDGSPPVGSRGEAPAVGLGDEVPQKLMHFFINKH